LRTTLERHFKDRAETFGLLTRLRQTLRDEIAHDPKLPSDLERQVFGFFDEIETKQGSKAAAAKTPPDVSLIPHRWPSSRFSPRDAPTFHVSRRRRADNVRPSRRSTALRRSTRAGRSAFAPRRLRRAAGCRGVGAQP
jgi:hypothetical protein